MLTKMSLYAHILKPGAPDSEFQYHLWQGKPIVFNGKKKKPFMLTVTFPTGERVTYRMRINLQDAILGIEIVDTDPKLVKTLSYSMSALRSLQATEDAKRLKALAQDQPETVEAAFDDVDVPAQR
jgi:hypothetical protein